MSCENIRELLALRLYDELEGSEGARVDAHLLDCEACRKAAAELERGLGRLRVASNSAAPPGPPALGCFHVRHVAAAFAAGLLASWFASWFATSALVPRGSETAAVSSASASADFRRADKSSGKYKWDGPLFLTTNSGVLPAHRRFEIVRVFSIPLPKIAPHAM